jgi:hypothetical protein
VNFLSPRITSYAWDKNLVGMCDQAKNAASRILEGHVNFSIVFQAAGAKEVGKDLA